MTYWKKCSALLLAVLFISGCAEFNAILESPNVSGRKKLMRSFGKNMKGIKAAAKSGDGAALAKSSAALYKAAGKLKKAFSKQDMDGNTRALPALWKNKADFNLKADNLAASAAVLAQIWSKSGNKSEITSSIKRIGGACGACHKAYRAKKKK